mmetsp:Transcript_12326/g.16938  ORF Transcript_12326/g.16938 Transcript_12326/m.16938 type:complete len:349 (+) Transcript_12326:44-1090(+)
MKTSVLVLIAQALISNAFNGPLPSNRRFISSIINKLSMSSVDAPAIVHQIFIGNLPFSVDESALRAAVDEKLSDVTYSSMRLQIDNRTGKSRGFAYFHFTQKESAEAALAQLTGLQIEGRDLKVDLSEPRPERPKIERAPQENSVFIGNLDFSVREDQILDMCNDLVGPNTVNKVRLPVDRETGRPRGFGHIDFKTPEDAKRAIQELNGVQLLGRELRVDQAQRKDATGSSPSEFASRPGRPERTPFAQREPRREQQQARDPNVHSVFIGNLAWNVSQEMAEEMLTDVLGAGSYSRVRLATDRETGRARGFGHIDFKDAASAERAIAELNGLEVCGRQLRVDFAGKKT